ncbi:S8 family serine peptidase [Paraconexibacter antarcticus]|uniref:S8 family serine peptidase n=1 Tax=Paraconexibacter antarcticus TaxID=2949664 RepID=A0ABY5DU00_9ACTN|nr:S8 family serine peptidase [Paraconexibacter antarcticus]UTI65510.1 S8 family serine peptidase [Paraconexibacter antarcticus]
MGPSPIALRRRLVRLAVASTLLGAAALPAAAGAATGRPVIPSDPLYADQAQLQDGASIGAPEAWEVTQGAGVVVAVLDTGVDESHPDLRGALWTNPGEIPGNGIDDDHDGYVDDVHGVDLVNHDGDPADDNGHGTHVAGIIGARANGEGSVGLAPKAQLMAVKVLDANRAGSADTVAAGIRYALAHGADVINVSVNGSGESDVLRSAVQAAGAAGVSIVASAGNDGADLGLTPSYPASYPDPAMLAVAATDGDSLLADFSNFGRGVQIAADGVGILSTSSTGGYELRSGTSMAAPEVAAALALLHSARPDMADSDLRAALLATARRPAGLLGRVAAGSLDVAAALHQVVSAAQWPSAAVAAAPVLRARVKRRSGASAARARARVLVTWTVTGDASRVAGFRLRRAGHTVARRSGAAARGAWITRRRGRVTVLAIDAAGRSVARASVTVK